MNRWDLSCPDWKERLRDGRSLVPHLPLLNVAAADRAERMFNLLKLADVQGLPRLGPVLPDDPPEQQGDACGQWFRDLVRAWGGSLDAVTRARMIREILLLVPKKNSKTSYGALLMLVALLMNETPRAKFLMTAPVQDVADLALQQVIGAIRADPVLDGKLWIREHKSQIVHRVTEATLEIMTFDPAVVTGQKVHGALIDELHIVSKMSKADKAIRQLRGGMLPFPSAFLIMITTQSEDQPAGLFRQELIKAREIRDGKVRDGVPLLPVLYEFPEEIQTSRDMDWKNPRVWPMVTPNLGRSITLESLRQDMVTAERTSLAELRAWASQHLNIEIGLAMAAAGWAGQAHWEKCGFAYVDLDYILEHAEVITAGIDGGGLDDLLGLVILGREPGGRWLLWAHAWCTAGVLDRRKEIASRLRDFEADGDLTILDEPGEDVEQVADVIERCEKAGLLDDIGVDTVGLGAIVDAIVARKIDFERLKGISQGYKLMGYIQTLERKLAAGHIAHGARPMMAWCVGNAKPEPRGNATMITKQTAGTAKIDPLMAAFNAVALMSMNPKPKKKKYQMFFAGA